MNKYHAAIVFLYILYIVGTHGRHVENEEYETPEEDEQSESMNPLKNHGTQMRHHRRTRQMFYDYPPPFYHDPRRYYGSRQQDDYYSRILKSLDEIISHLNRPPPPPPQPVYIPYPVFQYRPCPYPNQPNKSIETTKEPNLDETTTQIPKVTIRWPEMEDDNQNWGISIPDEPEVVDEVVGDGSRPISFDPVPPNRPTSRPPPPVDHGSVQSGMEQSTAAPIRRPGVCETAILTCCSMQDKTSQRNCFARYDCVKTYSTNRACDPNVIKKVLEHFSKVFAPVKKG